MNEIVCPRCGKIYEYDAERPTFCSKCGAKFDNNDTELDALLAKAEKLSEDAVAKHDVLMQAKQLYPNSFEVERQLLYLGRLYERGGKPDFYRIPYWPLAVFETPRSFSKKQRAEMLERFFGNQELERVKALAPDGDKFMDEYIERMAREYVELFIKGSSANSTFFGFRRKPIDVMRRSAHCLCTMLKNVDRSDSLDTEMKMRLEWALARGFARVFENENGEEYLKSLL